MNSFRFALENTSISSCLTVKNLVLKYPPVFGSGKFANLRDRRRLAGDYDGGGSRIWARASLVVRFRFIKLAELKRKNIRISFY